VANYGTLTLANAPVSGNAASSGGGYYFGGGSGGGVFNRGTVTLTSCSVTGNSAGGGSGGGLYNGGTATLTNCTISGNTDSPGFVRWRWRLGHRRVFRWRLNAHTTLTNCTSVKPFRCSAGGIANYGVTTLPN